MSKPIALRGLLQEEKKQQVHLKAMNLAYCLIRKEGCAEQKQHVSTHACDTIQLVK